MELFRLKLRWTLFYVCSQSLFRVLTLEQQDRLNFLRQAAQIEPALPAFKATGLL